MPRAPRLCSRASAAPQTVSRFLGHATRVFPVYLPRPCHLPLHSLCSAYWLAVVQAGAPGVPGRAGLADKLRAGVVGMENNKAVATSQPVTLTD